MKIYMDNCCFNRILDDRSYAIIYLDSNSVMMILELVENGIIELYGSKMLEVEISETPDYLKKKKLELMYSLCSHRIKITEEVLERAVEIQQSTNIREKDSIHLACAEIEEVDYFITVDKKLKNNASRMPARIKVVDPTECLMEVLYGNED